MKCLSRCVTREHKIARSLRMARRAGFEYRVGARLTIRAEVPKTPAAGRRVLLRVLDHELHVRRWPRNEGLLIAENLVILLRRHVAVVQSSDDGAVRIRERPVTVRLDRRIVAQNSGETMQVALFMCHRDQPPVAIS